MKALQITDLSVQYAAHHHEQAVLHKLALDLHDDDILCLLGASGCGKTTLLKAIAGLVPLAQGKIELNQRDLAQVPVEQRNIGMIFQDYALFPHLTVAENIAFGLNNMKRTQQQAVVAEMAELVKLSPFLKRYPHELSGGQQQRVAIARSLACKPDLLLLDEPFSNIDSQVRYQLIDEIKTILKNQKVPAIFVTHSKEEAFVFADKLALMEQGKIVQFGEPAQLYQQPRSRFVADFLGQSNYLACNLLDSHTALSVLGELRSEQPLTLANDTAIDPKRPLFCLVRPQELRLHPTADREGVPASIIASRFLGHTFEYRLQLENQRLSAYSTRHFAIGANVTLQLRLSQINLYHL